MNENILEIKNLCAYFKCNFAIKNAKNEVQFELKNIHLELKAGQRVGVVGLSGSGKSVLARIISQLEDDICITNGEVCFFGDDLLKQKHITFSNYNIFNGNKINKILGKDIAYIPQEPLSALNPLHKVKKQIYEVLKIHNLYNKDSINLVHKLCNDLHLDISLLNRYPNELSGGQRQRVAICIALIANPKLVICDEPTTALDTNLSLQTIMLLKEMSIKKNIAMIFITHDLGILTHFTKDVFIMQNGEFVEKIHGFKDFKNEYTKNLFNASFLAPRKSKNKNAKFKNDKFESDKCESDNAKNNDECSQKYGAVADEDLKTQDDSQIVLKLIDFSVGIIKHRFFKKEFYPIAKNINLSLKKKETLGIIGQSGSGKSSLAKGILHLMATSGTDIYFDKILSKDGRINEEFLRSLRQNLQIIFQDSASSLNPRFRVRELISEGLVLQKMPKDTIMKTILEQMEILELSKNLLDRYPSDLSGGQRQRVAIARAMVLAPKILILDEPTSALDKFVQKKTLELLDNLQERFDLSYVLITHDLDVINNMCDVVAVINEGQIIEVQKKDNLFKMPQHEITKGLIKTYQHTLAFI